MSFDGTITLGTIIEIAVMVVGIITAWVKLERKLTSFAVNLEHHASAIEKHTIRLDDVDKKLLSIIGDLQRLIGRSEVMLPVRTIRSSDTP